MATTDSPPSPRPLDGALARLAAAPTTSRPPPRYDDARGSWHVEKRALRNTS